MALPKSRTFPIKLQSAFRFTTPEEKEVLIQAIRLYVLYEDLKIELMGAESESISVLEGTSKETRRFYFVRRTFGTLLEISGAMQALENKEGFPAFKKRMDDKNLAQWNKSLKFFRDNHQFLKDCRNDVGGHFLDDAAKFALENLEDTVELFEIYLRGKGADCKIKFAYYFVAQALVKNKDKSQTVVEFLEKKYFPFIIEACDHAIQAIQVFAVTQLFH